MNTIGGTLADANGQNGQYNLNQYHALPSAIALCAGLSTLLMGLVGNMPLVVAPGFALAKDYRALVLKLASYSGVNAANMVVGAILVVAALTARYAKPISSLPEDLRLGLTAGIGAFICLIGLRNSHIITTSGAIVSVWDYKALLGMLGIIIIAIIGNRGGEGGPITRYAYIIEIVIISVISICIGVGKGTLTIPPMVDEQYIGELAGQISVESWNDKGFEVLEYIIRTVLNMYTNIFGSVTAIVLVACITKLGYNKEIFHETLKESKKLSLVFLAGALANLIIAPLLGICLVTPFLQSVAGVSVGARTGFSSVVSGTLFLLSTPFAEQIPLLLPSEAAGPAMVVCCFTVIKCLRHIDDRNPVKMIPAYIAFVLIPFTTSIVSGFSYAYIVLFATWVTSDMWTSITPQMVFGLSYSVLFALLSSNILSTLEQLVIVSIFLLGVGILGAIFTYKCCTPIQSHFGIHHPSSETAHAPTRVTSQINNQTQEKPHVTLRDQSAKSGSSSFGNPMTPSLIELESHQMKSSHTEFQSRINTPPNEAIV